MSYSQSCTASFQYDTNSYFVNFYNTSTTTNNIYKSYWNFGDGNYSTLPNPIHAYTKPGKYKVFLKVVDTIAACKNIFMDTVEVLASSPGCKALFSTKVFGDTLHCYNLSTGVDSATEYFWFFENTLFSTDDNPVWKVNKTGIRNVQLAVKSSNCIDTFNIDVYIKPKYECNATFETYYSRDTMYFYNKGYNPNAVYFWDFGDNTTASGMNPVHIYQYNGSYKVTLFIEDTISGCNDQKNYTVSVVGLPPFKLYYSYVINNLKVDFNASAKFNQPKDFIYSWQLGDGNTALGSNISHTYTADGTYNVILTVVDTPVSAVVTKKFKVIIKNSKQLFDIGGIVKYGNGEFADQIMVMLIENDSNSNNICTTIDTFKILPADSGMYFFKSIRQGRYSIKTVPNRDSKYYERYLPTYSGNSYQWDNAMFFNVNQDILQSIELKNSTINTNGQFSISGKLFIEKNVSTKYSCVNQTVFLLDANNVPLKTTLTDFQGNYHFDSIPSGLYMIKFDIIGKQSYGKLLMLKTGNHITIHFELDGFSIHPYDTKLATSVINKNILQRFNLYPNPASDRIFLNSDDFNQYHFSLVDSWGRIIIYNKPIMTNLEEIDLSNCVDGIYYIIIQNSLGFKQSFPFSKY